MPDLHFHWADEVAAALEGRGGRHVIETGTSISGVPHVGNASDVIRGDAVRKVLADRDINAELIWIADDGDPFRKVPKGMESLREYLGFPVYDIPDPGKCHRNFVDHFAKPFVADLEKYGVTPTVYSSIELYRSGKLLDEIEVALENRGKIRAILNGFRKTPLPEDYIPWSPICSKCGRISTTKAYGWDGDKIVSYVCSGVDPSTESKDLMDVSGCGHKGESDITKGEGKLPWRVEWAARWSNFKVTCEPFGKEHATVGGSYDTSKLISKEVFGWEPPYPVVYEFFTLNGEKISSSKGNVITLGDWLEICEPEVLKFFMYKRLQKQRDIKLDMIPNMVDEYDKGERIYFELEEEEAGSEEKHRRMYELSQVSQPQLLQVPFTLCAVLAQLPRVDIPRVCGRLETMGYDRVDCGRLERRIEAAGRWVEKYGPEQLKFRILENPESVAGKLSAQQIEGLVLLSKELGKRWKPEDFHKLIYNTARGIGLEPNGLFEAIYLSLINKVKGPKAASLILSLDGDFVKKRFMFFKQ
ncbi:MAG: lysine--tRNA ligase [Candidatus Altiarchaeota archaeon]|nr:lysine--tRNA ligase [Candidatus Altiarchaeota archaeon]